MIRIHKIIPSLIFLCIVLFVLDLNYAKDPPYARIYPPFSHQNSREKACLADVGAITRGQHRFLGPTCQILYCPPDPNIEEITVIECDDYVNKTNLPENFPDTEKRMYLMICQYCKPVSPTINLDLEPNVTTPLVEISTKAPTNISSTIPTNEVFDEQDEETDLP